MSGDWVLAAGLTLTPLPIAMLRLLFTREAGEGSSEGGVENVLLTGQ